MSEPLILVGGGGHCAAVIDVIETEGRWAIAGLLDLPQRVGETQLDYPVVGTDDQIAAHAASAHLLVTVGQIKSPALRRRLYERIVEAGGRLPVVVSPRAHVSRHAQVGSGSVVMHRALVNAGARVGVNAIVNTSALIEHDAVVGDHCHISTGAVVNGACTVGDGCFIGSNATLVHGVTVAERCVVGAGTVIVRDTKPGKVYFGNPARAINAAPDN